ncbi:MAG: hybrid sensor histidine kinase/response regulator, partial [Aliifodinibius sp.]|nr:hybrid sensor histidine kinase/response regulator [Fodinibius sp.]NIV12130.1 hybrid sensor histidine kinase/response regulator [Fodinibius sp.]NIY25767.1 hybrid sensor histidine kinase/response regulator [Fodinibius sp.]
PSYNYTIADSVAEAKKVLNSEEFDIIITDYSLGDGTAFDILELIIDTPIIITTGAGDEEIAVKALK